METITLRDLVHLARNGLIPSFFFRTWSGEEATLHNPVKTALDVNHNRRVNGQRCLATVYLSFCLTLGVVIPSDSLDQKIQGVVGAMLLISAVWLVFYGFFMNEPVKVFDVDIISAEMFCAHLSAFCKWSGCKPETLVYHDDAYLKETARIIMMKSAMDVLALEASDDSDDQLRLQITRGNMMAEFVNRKNVLQRLGLVSGGYDKHFNDAKKEMKKCETGK